MKFITGEPALLVGETLAVSDLHIGIEREYRVAGIKMPSQTHTMKKRLDFLLKETGAKKLLICGDLKHKVPGTSLQEEREIPQFLEHFLKKIEVEIVQGNHDADMKPLLPNGVKLHGTEGVLLDRTYYSHGHTWPSSKLLKASAVVAGHVQPQIEIRDKLGYVWREPVWVKAGLDSGKVEKKYSVASSPELIILPSFNRMAGGLALNKKQFRESPFLQLTNLKEAKLYLLDGTFLGRLRDL